jgi:hypothetical protein
MLVEKNNSLKTQIVAFRIANGEEIMGKCIDQTDETVTITKPVVIQMQMLSSQQAGIGFAPYMVSVEEDGDYTFRNSTLLSQPMKVRADISASYIKMTTGLDVPATSKIIKP